MPLTCVLGLQMYKTFFYHKEFLKKFKQTHTRSLCCYWRRLQEILTFALCIKIEFI